MNTVEPARDRWREILPLLGTSDVLRGLWRCPYYDDDHKFVGTFPAVLAPIIGPDGTLQSVQRIYTATDLEPRKKNMPAVDKISGGAVRLFPAAEEFGIAEGLVW